VEAISFYSQNDGRGATNLGQPSNGAEQLEPLRSDPQIDAGSSGRISKVEASPSSARPADISLRGVQASTRPVFRRIREVCHDRDIFAPPDNSRPICDVPHPLARDQPEVLAQAQRRLDSRLGRYDSQRCAYPARLNKPETKMQQQASLGHPFWHQTEPQAGPSNFERDIRSNRSSTPDHLTPEYVTHRPHVWREPQPSETVVRNEQHGHGQPKSYFEITPPRHRFRESLHILRRKASRFATNLGFGRDKTGGNQNPEHHEVGLRERRIRSNRSLPAMRQQAEEQTFLTSDEAELVPPLPLIPLRHRVTFDDFGHQVETDFFTKPCYEERKQNCRGKGKEGA